MATLYEQKFRDVLALIFQLDQADLDFGIYRIMNQKRKDIEVFLNNRLIPEVTAILRGNATSGTDLSAMENEVFSHLTKFFSRYYEGGDFISKRRYKDDTYAIPYSGEEVKLYWANADQYYIKTSEYFKNYSFVLPTSRRKVHFVLRDAETEQNNNKTANNMERRFRLCEENFIEEVDGEINIYFTYELMAKTTKQDALIKDAEEKVLPVISAEYVNFAELVTTKAPTDKNKERTLLMKHLQDYTAKNNFDYFIHKDLGGFLRRELDFYIKNEVMFLDDLDANHIMEHLAQVKAIKQVGEKIITFLAQLEDFQKKLWLKKKFVVGCDYCITLDRIPHALYPEIIANTAQREEWMRLFAIDEIKGDMMTEGYSEPLSEKFLEENPFLVLDTKFFDAEFKHKVVESMENVDEECNGLLINSENFQALELLQEKYREAVKYVYIDPPYNANSSEILYKNTFKHASWLSLMENRLNSSKKLLNESSVYTIAIDDVEFAKLGVLSSSIFYNYSGTNCVSVIINPSGQMGKNFSVNGEYLYFYYNDIENMLAKEQRSEENADVRGFMNGAKGAGGNYLRTSGKTCFYPIYIDGCQVLGFGDVCSDDFHPKSANEEHNGKIAVYPIDAEGTERKWLFGRDTVEDIVNELEVNINRNTGLYEIKRKKTDINYKTIWTDKKYSAKENGTNLLKKLFKVPSFSYPKSLYAVEDCVSMACRNSAKAIILDFFAGSGTTGHAVIEENKKDKGNRKYILCEMGAYFNTVTKPRIEKVIYSEDWKDGKPISRKGISQCFKYLRLEQYEDTLNNLQPKQTDFEFKDDMAGFEESYLLRYMLDTEAKGDLFNLEWFVHPFSMTLKTTKDNELIDTPVDMVETFNYLIGLNVETMRWPKDGYCVVEGTTHVGNERTLVIWRDCEKVSNEALNEFFRKQAYSTTDSEFDKIYVNGDNTLPNIKTDEEHWKVVLIEEEFKKRMFGN